MLYEDFYITYDNNTNSHWIYVDLCERVQFASAYRFVMAPTLALISCEF